MDLDQAIVNYLCLTPSYLSSKEAADFKKYLKMV
jgi:hypothetical protein